MADGHDGAGHFKSFGASFGISARPLCQSSGSRYCCGRSKTCCTGTFFDVGHQQVQPLWRGLRPVSASGNRLPGRAGWRVICALQGKDGTCGLRWVRIRPIPSRGPRSRLWERHILTTASCGTGPSGQAQRWTAHDPMQSRHIVPRDHGRPGVTRLPAASIDIAGVFRCRALRPGDTHVHLGSGEKVHDRTAEFHVLAQLAESGLRFIGIDRDVERA